MAGKLEKRPVIVPGYRAGQLTVEEATAVRRCGYVVWRCRCDCGGERLLDTRCLQRGSVTDCGCRTKVAPGQKDLTGQRFGKLVCLEPTDGRGENGALIWRCRCDCGNLCEAQSTQLQRGYRKSCGCLGHPPLKDYVGRRFGKLTVTGYAGKQNGMHRWACRCDCGRETTVGQTLLQSGKTKSCGCIQTGSIVKNLKLYDGTSVTKLESSRKKRIASNTSGYTGVYRHQKSGKWMAQITFKGKTYYLGSYDRLEDAVQARRKGEEMHGTFLQWYYDQFEKDSGGT